MDYILKPILPTNDWFSLYLISTAGQELTTLSIDPQEHAVYLDVWHVKVI